MEKLKKYQFALIMLVFMVLVYLIDHDTGKTAFLETYKNVKTMFILIPPIFIIMGLLDVWIEKETLIKYMGPNSKLSGIFIALLLGTAAAGPVYISFPIGVLLLKKGARLAYVIFFVAVWSMTKIVIILFEIASLGLKFTLIQVLVCLPLALIMALIIEKAVSKKELDQIINKN